MATAEMYKPISWIFLRTPGLTVWTTSDTFRIRGHSVPKDPKTTDQVNSRAFLCEAKRQWAKLSDTEKAAWKSFARKCIDTNKREQPVIGRGIDAFIGASITRQTAGLGAMPALPEGNFIPMTPTALDLLPGADARELVFRIEHKIESLSSHAMLVRMTPTGATRSRSPYKCNLRHVRGVGPDSVIALPESGAVVRIPKTRFELVPGCTYAVEVRIMRLADGVVSETFYAAAIREEEAVVALDAAVVREEVPAVSDAASMEKPAAAGVEAAPLREEKSAAKEEAAVSGLEQVAQTTSADKALDPLEQIRKAMHERSCMEVIAERRGSKYFPSAHVLDRHFNPKGYKKREKPVYTNINESNVVDADYVEPPRFKPQIGGNKAFGKYMAMMRYMEKNFM